MNRSVVLTLAALLLVVSQTMLVFLGWTFDGARPKEVAEVLPLILLLAVPAAVGLGVLPLLENMQAGIVATSTIVICGLLMRLVWFGTPAPLEDDFYRYLWDGALVAHGINPFGLAPGKVMSGNDPSAIVQSIQRAGETVLMRINFRDLETIYPGTAQVAFASAYFIRPWSIDGLRVVFLLADSVAAILIFMLCQRIGRSGLLAAGYWMNPLVVFSSIGTAHVDALIVPLLLGTVFLLAVARPIGAAALLGLAVGVKIWPILLFPILLATLVRRKLPVVGAATIFAGITLLTLGPLLAESLSPNAGIAAYARQWSNNNGFYAWISYGAQQAIGDAVWGQTLSRLTSAVLVGIVALLCALRPAQDAEDILGSVMIVSATLFYAAPAQFPWYALWFLPVAATLGYQPLLLASVTLPAYYFFFPLWESGHGNVFMFGIAFAHSLPVLAWIAWKERIWIRWRRPVIAERE